CPSVVCSCLILSEFVDPLNHLPQINLQPGCQGDQRCQPRIAPGPLKSLQGLGADTAQEGQPVATQPPQPPQPFQPIMENSRPHSFVPHFPYLKVKPDTT